MLSRGTAIHRNRRSRAGLQGSKPAGALIPPCRVRSMVPRNRSGARGDRNAYDLNGAAAAGSGDLECQGTLRGEQTSLAVATAVPATPADTASPVETPEPATGCGSHGRFGHCPPACCSRSQVASAAAPGQSGGRRIRCASGRRSTPRHRCAGQPRQQYCPRR